MDDRISSAEPSAGAIDFTQEQLREHRRRTYESMDKANREAEAAARANGLKPKKLIEWGGERYDDAGDEVQP